MAAIRMLFDWLVVAQILTIKPVPIRGAAAPVPMLIAASRGHSGDLCGAKVRKSKIKPEGLLRCSHTPVPSLSRRR